MVNENLAKHLQEKAKKVLWNKLGGGQLTEYKFRRRFPIGLDTVDFVCLEKKLVIEVTDRQEAKQLERDSKLDAWLHEHGFEILRFTSDQVLKETETVLEKIRAHLPPIA